MILEQEFQENNIFHCDNNIFIKLRNNYYKNSNNGANRAIQNITFMLYVPIQPTVQ